MKLKRTMAVLNQLIPMLYQRKMQEEQVRRWLEKSLAEYEAWGKQQETVQNRSLQNAITEMIVKLGLEGAQDLDRPVLGGLERLEEAGVGEAYPELRLPTPRTSYEEAVIPYQDLAKSLVESKEGMRLPEAQAIINAIRLKGSDFLDEWVKDVVKTQQAEKERGIRAGELKEKEKSRQLSEKELAQREKEFKGETGKGKKKTDLEKDLDNLSEDRWTAIEDIEDLDPEIDEEKYKTLKSKILNLNTKIKSLKEKVGSDPDKRHAAAAKELKQKGYTENDILSDPDVKAEIENAGLSVWILLEYFK
jgi:hypothetical protein